MKEEWKDVVGFEGLYKISNLGNVYSVRNKKIMKPFNNKGYLRIGLFKDGKRIKKLVHVLVAEAFISKKPHAKAQVNHKDLNTHNNKVDNLEWVMPKENVRHAIKNINGREQYLKQRMHDIGKIFGWKGAKASRKPVAQLDRNTNEIIKVFESAREAYYTTGVNYKNISQVCRRQRKTAGGFKWAFYMEGLTTIETTSTIYRWKGVE